MGRFFICWQQQLSAIYLWHKIITIQAETPHSLSTTAIIIFALSKFATIFHDFDDKKRAETPEEKQRKMRFNIAFATPWEKNQKYRG